MAAQNYMTMAERVVRELEAKRRLLSNRPGEPIEPSALRELVGAVDLAVAELHDLKLRCSQAEDAARANHRATSPLLGRRDGSNGGRRRAARRRQATDSRATRTFIDRSIADLRQIQAMVRPTDIDLRDSAAPRTSDDGSAPPPPPARLRSDDAGRAPTAHERAMLEWLAASLHDVIATQSKKDWPGIGRQLLEGYGDARPGLEKGHAELQAHLLRSTYGLARQDQLLAVDELTASYALLQGLPASVDVPG